MEHTGDPFDDPLSCVADLVLEDQSLGVMASVKRKLIEARFPYQNILESQALLAGLLNYKIEEFGKLDDLDRLINLFSGHSKTFDVLD